MNKIQKYIAARRSLVMFLSFITANFASWLFAYLFNALCAGSWHPLDFYPFIVGLCVTPLAFVFIASATFVKNQSKKH